MPKFTPTKDQENQHPVRSPATPTTPLTGGCGSAIKRSSVVTSPLANTNDAAHGLSPSSIQKLKSNFEKKYSSTSPSSGHGGITKQNRSSSITEQQKRSSLSLNQTAASMSCGSNSSIGANHGPSVKKLLKKKLVPLLKNSEKLGGQASSASSSTSTSSLTSLSIKRRVPTPRNHHDNTNTDLNTMSLCTATTTTTATHKKRNFISRKLFNMRKNKNGKNSKNNNDATENDLTTYDMRTDRSYLDPTEDDDFTGRSYLDYSSGEEEGMDDLVDVFGIDTPTRFTPRKSRLASQAPTPGAKDLSSSKLSSFLKNRLPSFRLPEESEPVVSSSIASATIPVYDNNETSVTDAIFANYERSKSFVNN